VKSFSAVTDRSISTLKAMMKQTEALQIAFAKQSERMADSEERLSLIANKQDERLTSCNQRFIHLMTELKGNRLNAS